jgi:hypothetical protein
MSTSPSGQSFFGFSSDYAKYQLDEFYLLAKNMHVSWTDFMKMPSYARRYFVDKIIELSQKTD